MNMKIYCFILFGFLSNSVFSDSLEENRKSKKIIENKLEFMAFCSLSGYEFTCLNGKDNDVDICIEYGVTGCTGRELYSKIAGAWIGVPYIETPASVVAGTVDGLASEIQANIASSQAASAAAASAAAASAAAASAAAASAAAASAAAASAAAPPPPAPM